MTEQEYTPTTEQIFSWLSEITTEKDVRGIRRWLAEHDRQVAAETLEQAARNMPFPQDPYGGFHQESLRGAFVQGTNWLRARAQAIREAHNER